MQIASDDLWAFGEWALDHDVFSHLDVKSNLEIVMRDKVENPDRPVPQHPPITDELADKIDKALCQLFKYDETLGMVFMKYYVYKYTYRNLADWYGCSRNKIDKLLSEATGFIMGAVSNEENACLS